MRHAGLIIAAILLIGCSSKPRREDQGFLAQNAQKDGVVVRESGLQYKVIREGKGRRPSPFDIVKVSYRGRLTDGTVFDTSSDHGGPVEFRVGEVVRGWVEALQLMREGAKWQVVVPPDLGYGGAGRGPVPPNAVMIFDLDLVKIIDPRERPVEDEGF